MNDKILKFAGGSWDDPPAENDIIEVGKKNKEEIQYFIETKTYFPNQRKTLAQSKRKPSMNWSIGKPSSRR